MPDPVQPYGQWNLKETIDGICQGVCPVCLERWAADPDRHCSCTRPRPDDAAQLAAALAVAGKLRAAALEQHRIDGARRNWRPRLTRGHGRHRLADHGASRDLSGRETRT